MAGFKAPLEEIGFVLRHVACAGEFMPDDGVMDAVLDGAASFAEGVWAPLLRVGDVAGPRLTDNGVRMPAGFRDAYRAYVEGGWGTIGAPEAFGGQGLPFVLSAAVLELLGSANAGFALCPILTAGAIEALLHHGSPGQQARYLPSLSTGRWTGTMNLTEPQAGSDVGALRTRATPRGDGTWSIKGTKIFISFGDHDLAENIIHLVLARTPDAAPGTRGVSMFLVPKHRLDAEGGSAGPNDVRTVSIEHKLGLHASPTCVLSFGDRDECVGELVGPEFGGMRAMFTMMNNARLNIGLQGVQIAEAATQRAVRYARDRVQGSRASSPAGAPVAILEHPDVRRMVMRMKAQTMAARALVYFASAEVDRVARGREEARPRLDLLTPLAKAHATDLGNEVASLGVQVHGGPGFIEDTGAAQHFRDARIAPIYEGTNGIQAADLVMRKIGLRSGMVLAELVASMRAEARDAALRELIEACGSTGARLREAAVDDRLAASTPFLTMLSVATCGWLMERMGRALPGDTPFERSKRTVCRFYVAQIVPEALGLRAAAGAGADILYELDADALAL